MIAILVWLYGLWFFFKITPTLLLKQLFSPCIWFVNETSFSRTFTYVSYPCFMHGGKIRSTCCYFHFYAANVTTIVLYVNVLFWLLIFCYFLCVYIWQKLYFLQEKKKKTTHFVFFPNKQHLYFPRENVCGECCRDVRICQSITIR